MGRPTAAAATTSADGDTSSADADTTSADAGFDWAGTAERYRPYLYRVASALDRGGADEIVQEALLRARRGPPRHQPALIGAWLAAIARNVHRDRIRYARRRPVQALPEPDAGGGLPSRAHPTEAVVDIAACVDALPEDFRDVIVLGGMGFGCEEIAARLRVPEGTVKSRMHRGRAALRRMLADEAEAPAGRVAARAG